MANIIPPPLPPPPPRLSINPLIKPPNPVVKNASVVAAAAAARPGQAPAPKKPYITIKNLTTVVDASIGRHVDDLDERIALKELPVIGPSGTSKSTAAPKFERTQGDFPDLKVDIYEQMVYHRAKSTNNKRLEIFVPSRYKINYDKIKQYFATKGADKDVDDLKKTVISAYGNNYNSLFYKHTIAGKTVPAAASAAAAARTGLASSSTGGDLDKLAMESIQNKIDRWHFNYAEWSFYDNASSFFVQKTMLPQDELLTLKMDFDDVFGGAGAGAGAGAGGLITIVDEISGKYTGLKAKYDANIQEPVITTASSTLDNYNKLFKILYDEIDKRKTEPLDYVTERQLYFPSYTFDVNTRNYLLRAFERLHNISQEMTTVSFGDTPINSKIKLLETLNDEYIQLIQGIERDANLKNANDIFTKYMLGPNKKYDGKFIPNYKIIQYIFWLIRGGGAAAGDVFVNNAFEVDYATADVNPEVLYGLIQNLSVAGLTPEEVEKRKQFMKDEATIKKYEFIIELLNYRIRIDQLAIGGPYPERDHKIQSIIWNQDNANVSINNKGAFTTLLNKELGQLGQAVVGKPYDSSCSQRIIEIKSKIRELKGKHFASMLIFYNYIEAKKTDGTAEIAEFFNTFYEESKLMNPEIDSHSSIVGDNPKTVPTFSFGIDIIFWTLLRITKYYSGKHINFIKTMKEKIGPENPDLRNMRLEIGVKESKLKHVCELIANTGNIPIDTIIPDRAGYYIKDGSVAQQQPYIGFVDPVKYRAEWLKKIDPAKGGGETANDIIRTTNKMKKKLDESLGMNDASKMAEMLSTLIEMNTVQVVNMLFARPRNIWYSPDLQIKGTADESSKWILFQLDKPQIISGRAFSKFKKELGAPVGGTTRLERILDKKSTEEVSPIDISSLDNAGAAAAPFLIFIIATQPVPPRMLDKDNMKDATDVMFDDPLFIPAGVAAGAAGAAGGIIENGSNLKESITNTLGKIKGKILPTKESCATGKDAILNAATDLNNSFNKTLRSIGVDLEKKVDKFLQKAPPPLPGMIPPPLPPPPPSASALATHHVGQQAAAAAAAPPPPPPAPPPPPPAPAPPPPAPPAPPPPPPAPAPPPVAPDYSDFMSGMKNRLTTAVTALDSMIPPPPPPVEIEFEYVQATGVSNLKDVAQRVIDERVTTLSQEITAQSKRMKATKDAHAQDAGSRQAELDVLVGAIAQSDPQIHFLDLTELAHDLSRLNDNINIEFTTTFDDLMKKCGEIQNQVDQTTIPINSGIFDQISQQCHTIKTSYEEFNKRYDNTNEAYNRAEEQYTTEFSQKKMEVLQSIRKSISDQVGQLSENPAGIEEGYALLTEIADLLSSVL